MSKCKVRYHKRGDTDGSPIHCFLRGNTFYIGFKIMFLEILSKEMKISFQSNYDDLLLILEKRCPLSLRKKLKR